jgi:hypothetical protein
MHALKKLSRADRILLAQKRVTLANERLSELCPLDPRFADALNEYRDALDELSAIARVLGAYRRGVGDGRRLKTHIGHGINYSDSKPLDRFLPMMHFSDCFG